MNIPGTVISTLRLAHSLISEQESTSEKRRSLYNSVAGQRITFTPEEGEEIELHLRNCAYEEDNNITYLTVSVSDPCRPANFFKIQSDFRYHYLHIYVNRATELGNPLIEELHFSELGPEDYTIQLGVRSIDPPTLQMAFERVETILAQTHTEYHYYLRSLYDEYKDEFEVIESFEDGEFRYEVESTLDDDWIPISGEDVRMIEERSDEDSWNKMIHAAKLPSKAYDYVEYTVLAEEAGEDYFAL